MKLAVVQSKLKSMEEMINIIDSSQCDFYRDEKVNLCIKFNNGDVIRLPKIPFRPYQLETQSKLFKDGIKRFFLVRPRRAGKEVESWNLLVQSALESPGLYLMIYPTNVRARMVLWEGAITLPDGVSVKFLDMIPARFVVSFNNQEMSIKLTNGSVIRILGSDVDPDKLRGTNPRGVVLSEFAYSDPRVYHILMPILRQNNGWIILQTTFNGMNHAYLLMQNIKNNENWHCRVDSVESLVDERNERYVTDEMIEEDRRSGMPEYMIQQEYYSVVQINQETIYFANELNTIIETNRIAPALILVNQCVYTAWDIGINDCTGVVFFQLDEYNKPVIINYIESNNKKLEWYLNQIATFCNKHNLMMHSHYIPHDGQKRDFNTGKNTVDFGNDFGQKMYIVPRPTHKINAIQQMRQMLYKTRFNKENTGRLIECLSNYSKEYDIKHGIYKEKPLHNWTCHAVDAYQTMTLALDANMVVGEISREIVYYSN